MFFNVRLCFFTKKWIYSKTYLHIFIRGTNKCDKQFKFDSKFKSMTIVEGLLFRKFKPLMMDLFSFFFLGLAIFNISEMDS